MVALEGKSGIGLTIAIPETIYRIGLLAKNKKPKIESLEAFLLVFH
jgi:hypothetical protein